MMVDVKKRFLDHLHAAGYNIENDDVRLWFHIPDRTNPKLIQERALQVADGLRNPPKDLGEEWEVNSGVEFPGSCLEPLMNQALRVKELVNSDGCKFVAEFRENKS